MKGRGLIAAAVLLAGLSGLLYWSNEAEKAKEGQPDPDAPPKIIAVEEDTINRIEIVKTGSDPVTVELGDGDTWKITAPEPLRADQTTVSSLVTAVADLESNRLVEENATDVATFGLDQPQLVVTARQKEGGELKVLIGNETPTGSNFFAKLEGDPRVFTLASFNKTSLEKSAWDLRDKRLLTFDSDKLSRIELTAKGSTVELGKNAQNEWQIVKPQPFRADGGNVEQVLSRLRNAKMDAALSEEEAKTAAAEFNKAKPVATVKATDAAETQVLEVRKTSGDEYYAKSSVVDGIHKTTSDAGEGLDKGLDDLRNRKLFDFGFTDPSVIEIRHGGTTVAYEKKDDKWMRGDGVEMDALTVRALIDELRDLTALSFPASGFGEPVFEAKAVSADGSRIEKIQVSKSGDKYIARRENEPALYELKGLDVDRLQSIASDVKEPEKDSGGDKPEDKPVE
jgi:hypothetical protein